MIKKHLFAIIFVLLSIGYLVFFFGGLSSVPFHPDEATQLYMSSDLKSILSNPGSLAYDPGSSDSLRQHYRLVDAPLTRYAIGAGLAIAGKTPPKTDWDWSATWYGNSLEGAMPQPDILWIARLSSVFLFPLSLVAFYKALRSFSNPWVSLAGVLLLGLNSLFLVHTRRAMAEALQVSLLLFSLWIASKPYSLRNLWVVSVLLGLAAQAKQLLLPGVFALIVVMAYKGVRQSGWRSLAQSIGIPIGTITLLFVVLNPVMWKTPLQTASTMIAERATVSQRQAELFASVDGSLALTTPSAKAAGILAQTFFASPAYFDVGNYQDSLRDQVADYSSNFMNLAFSGWLWGIGFLFATLFSLVFILYQRIRWKSRIPEIVTICLWVGFCQIFAYACFLIVGFQRYYLVFIPLSLIVCLYGIQQSINQIQRKPSIS